MAGWMSEETRAELTAQLSETQKDQVMKRSILALALFGLTLAMSSGCGLNQKCNNCNGPLGCRPCKVGWQRGGTDYGAALSHSDYRNDNNVGSGVPAPATAYPYYTNRGPRDFFANNPPSIGR
jgi:hypothetical protein